MGDNKVMNLGNVGIDIGNAKTEIALFEKDNIVLERQPSVIVPLLKKPDPSDINIDILVKKLMDNLTVHISSKALRRDMTYFIGNKAISSGQKVENMNLAQITKATKDIPIAMSLSMLAAKGIQNYYNDFDELPKNLSISLNMATAIPSSEFSVDLAKSLENRFIGEHFINVYIANETVPVWITITQCKVTEEGKTAMLAFVNSPTDILKNYNELYGVEATPKDFLTAKAIHVDIGDGTSEFITVNGLNPVSSKGDKVGVGHATEKAIELYKIELGNYGGNVSRQEFMDLLQLNSEKSKIANGKLNEASFIQANEIYNKIEEVFSNSNNTDFFFVHGGGSVTFEKDLFPSLKELADTVKSRVVWIPDKYCSNLNSRGTLILAQNLFGDSN